MQRAAFVIVLMAGMHSMLEYPLWYSYFLLPTAFVFGLCLERPDGSRAPATTPHANVTRPFVLASMMLMLGGTLAVYDYMRVVVIFAPPVGAGPLEQRIADGRKSVLFAHHADYAEATSPKTRPRSMSAFARAPHYLLDSRLMMAWAKALDETARPTRRATWPRACSEFRNERPPNFSRRARRSAGPPAARLSRGVPNAPATPRPRRPTDHARPHRSIPCQAPTRLYRFEDFR